MSNRYFIYARKSTDTEDRQVRSIGDQLAELRSLAAKEQIEIVDVLIEKQSAKIPGRSVFNQMLERIESGEATGILAWHPDRLARNAIDGGQIIHLVDVGKILSLRFPTYWFEPTPQGKFMLSIAFGQSKYYVDSLSENVKRAQRQKTAAGIWSWRAPVGYLNDPKSRTIVVDPSKAPLVRRAFEVYAAGKIAMSRLCKLLKSEGLSGHRGKPLSHSQVQHLLGNPFYYGLLRTHGELFEGAHEPLVSKTLFDKVQRAMRNRSKPNPPFRKSYAYRGLLRCGECGATITMETQKGHNYLRCTKRVRACSQPYLREESLTEQIAEVLRAVSIPDRWADWLIERLENEHASDGARVQQAKKQVLDETCEIDRKLDRLMTAYLDGVIPVTDYRKKKEKLLGIKQESKERLALLERDLTERFEPIFAFIRRSKQAKTVAGAGNPEKMRNELEEIGSNLVLLDRKLHWSAQGRWKIVANQGSLVARRNPARDRNASASEKNTDLAYWSAVLDVVRMSFKDVSSVPSAGRPQEHPHQRIPYDITSMAQ